MGPKNTVRRVKMRGGWLGLAANEDQTKALARVIDGLNAEGYRVVFIVPDKFSFLRKVLNAVIFVITLGFVGFVENLIVIGEEQGL